MGRKNEGRIPSRVGTFLDHRRHSVRNLPRLDNAVHAYAPTMAAVDWSRMEGSIDLSDLGIASGDNFIDLRNLCQAEVKPSMAAP